MRLFATPGALRQWFAAFEAQELLLQLWKVASGRLSVTWLEAVDEAFCVGWIDGVRRVDRRRQLSHPLHRPQARLDLERCQCRADCCIVGRRTCPADRFHRLRGTSGGQNGGVGVGAGR